MYSYIWYFLTFITRLFQNKRNVCVKYMINLQYAFNTVSLSYNQKVIVVFSGLFWVTDVMDSPRLWWHRLTLLWGQRLCTMERRGSLFRWPLNCSAPSLRFVALVQSVTSMNSVCECVFKKASDMTHVVLPTGESFCEYDMGYVFCRWEWWNPS